MGFLSGLGSMLGSAISSASNVGIQKMINDSNERIAKWANETNLQLADKNNRANRDLSELAYRQNLEQWSRENEYNSPLQQMQRYKDAGLNPNLIYGQQNLSASSPQLKYERQEAGHVAPYQRQASNVKLELGDVFQSIMDFATYKNQLRKSNAEADSAEYQADIAKYESMMKASDANFRNDFNRANLTKTNEEISNLVESRKVIMQDYENKKITHSQLIAETNRINTQIESLNIQKKLYEAQIKKTNQDIQIGTHQNTIKENEAKMSESFYQVQFLNSYYNYLNGKVNYDKNLTSKEREQIHKEMDEIKLKVDSLQKNLFEQTYNAVYNPPKKGVFNTNGYNNYEFNKYYGVEHFENKIKFSPH